MSLIACRKCGTDVAETAPTCPKCGISIPSQTAYDKTNSILAHDRKVKKWMCVVAIVLAVYMIFGGGIEREIENVQRVLQE